MSWIKTIPYEQANNTLKRIYNRVKGPNNTIDNVLSIHSLKPHTLVGHMTLYKSVLHNTNNNLPKWYLEAIGVFVSKLNNCNYCVAHHFEGLKRLTNDKALLTNFITAIENNTLDTLFSKAHYLGICYAKKLSLHPQNIVEDDVIILKKAGFNDGTILELNQVTSYFNYVNRTVLGLGVTTKGDILGLAPTNSDNPEDWTHQ